MFCFFKYISMDTLAHVRSLVHCSWHKWIQTEQASACFLRKANMVVVACRFLSSSFWRLSLLWNRAGGEKCRDPNCKEVKMVISEGLLCEIIFSSFIQGCLFRAAPQARYCHRGRISTNHELYIGLVLQTIQRREEIRNWTKRPQWDISHSERYLNAVVISWCLFTAPPSLILPNLAWIGQVQPGNWFVEPGSRRVNCNANGGAEWVPSPSPPPPIKADSMEIYHSDSFIRGWQQGIKYPLPPK